MKLLWRALTQFPDPGPLSNVGILLFFFQRALCCFPGFSNPGTASRKGKISKPLLAGVDSTGSSSTASSKSRLLDDSGVEASDGIMDYTSTGSRLKGTLSRMSDGKQTEDMMLLEKQGRSSQRQRMQEGEQRRAGSLPPSSLPRPPRALKSASNSRYCRLSDTETRKKSDPGLVIDNGIKTRDSGNCTLEYGRFDTKSHQRRKKSSVTESFVQNNSLKKPSSGEYERLGDSERKKLVMMSDVKHRETQGRSLIPPPSRRIGDYGRLSDGDAKATLRKQAGISRGLSTGSTVSSKSAGARDSGGTASSEASTSSLPPTKARSIPRPSNYRIQF